MQKERSPGEKAFESSGQQSQNLKRRQSKKRSQSIHVKISKVATKLRPLSEVILDVGLSRV